MNERWLVLRPRLAHAAIVAAATLAIGCGGGDSGSAPNGGGGAEGPSGATTPSVDVVRAREGALPLRERLTGTVRAAGQVVISPQVSGPIVEVMAQNGERVRAGQPLVRIRAQTGRSQLQQARAQLEQARADLQRLEAQFERTRALAADSLVSQETLETERAELEAARATVQQREATVEEREEALDQTVVRAPIAGRVGQRNAEVGMHVSPQTALYTIGRLENMQVEVPVPQDLLSVLEVGQPVEIRTGSARDSVVRAEISRISPFLEQGSFTGQIEVDVSNHAGAFLPGMFVTVDVLYGQSDSTTVVPTSALIDRPGSGERGVYVVTTGDPGIHLVESDSVGDLSSPVEITFRRGDVVAEGRQLVGLRNVEPGAWIVVVGQHLLADRSVSGPVEARVRPVAWERVVDLQRLQRHDLVQQFLERQRAVARRWRDSLSADSASTPGAGSSL